MSNAPANARAETAQFVKNLIRTVPDWPQPGVQFRDITPLIGDPKGLRVLIDLFVERYVDAKLDYVAGALGLGHKRAHEGFTLWTSCIAGDEKAWDRMRRYNIQDVRLTEKLYDRILPWIPNHPHMGLYTDGGHCCPTCGSRRRSG